MKLHSFRIQNYKSIKDSGICYVENEITIFAGKNGSGKSNILEALSKFSNHKFDFNEDNYNYDVEKPIITNEYKLDENEINQIENTYKVKIEKYVTISLDTKNNDKFYYNIDCSIDFSEPREKNKKVVDRVKN